VVQQEQDPGADLYNARLTGETANTETVKVSAIDPLSSNSMKSSNPYSGFHETDYAKCLDTSGGNPVCNQGGNVVCHEVCAFTQNQREEVRELGEIAGSISSRTGTHQQNYVVFGIDQQGGKGNAAWSQDVMPSLLSDSHGTPHGVAYAATEGAAPDIVYPIEGNGQRASHQGDGWSEEQVGYTLNSVERHGVAYAINGNVCDRVSTQNGCGYSENVSPTLNTQDRHAVAYDIGEARLRNQSEYDEESPTITARCGSGGNNVPAVVYDARGNGDGETVQTLTGDHARSVSDYTPLVCSVDGEPETTVCKPASIYWDGGQVANTLTKKGMDQRMPDKGQFQCVLQSRHRKYIVRRLTPLECSRLQGMPDDWCDIPAQSNVTQEDLEHWRPILDEWAAITGKKPKSDAQIVKWLSSPVSESAQYQMYGNGIALPQWVWVCGRIIETYGEHKPTMASLFDGTGSFPLIWNSILGGAYTAWSSEVNPDAIRVSKYRME
jgi:DNA (cytosine-5)-methyltransferase 1